MRKAGDGIVALRDTVDSLVDVVGELDSTYDSCEMDVLAHRLSLVLGELRALKTKDEIEVIGGASSFTVPVEEALRLGREEYGPLILDSDSRDFLLEALEEIRDAFTYLLIENARRKRAYRSLELLNPELLVLSDLYRNLSERAESESKDRVGGVGS